MEKLLFFLQQTAILFTYLKGIKAFNRILYDFNNKSLNDDIIDYNKRTMMNIYLKSSDVCYNGKFFYRKENGTDSWISLIEYCSKDKKTQNPIFNPKKDGLDSAVAINIKDIERIEVFKDSEVWKRANWTKKKS